MAYIQRHQLQNLIHLVLIVLAVLLLVPLLMMAMMMPMMGGMEHGAMATTPMWGMMGLPLLIAIVVGYGIYRLVRQSGPSEQDPALEELRMAYARGDLSVEEFKQRQKELE